MRELRLMKGSKYTENSEEEQRQQELAIEEATHGKRNRRHRYNDAQIHPEIQRRTE